jgi:hypothetical protein
MMLLISSYVCFNYGDCIYERWYVKNTLKYKNSGKTLLHQTLNDRQPLLHQTLSDRDQQRPTVTMTNNDQPLMHQTLSSSEKGGLTDVWEIYKTFLAESCFRTKKPFGRKMFPPNNISAETLVPNEKICPASKFLVERIFRPKHLSTEKMLPDEKNTSD